MIRFFSTIVVVLVLAALLVGYLVTKTWSTPENDDESVLHEAKEGADDAAEGLLYKETESNEFDH